MRLVLLLLLPSLLFAQNTPFQSSNLPIVLISTGGQAIVDEPKIDATMQIIDNGPGQINHITDPATDYNGRIGIEIRGASSQAVYEKKPYDLELRDATGEDRSEPLLGMPSESDWGLIAPLNDKTLLRDMLAYTLARTSSLPWAPRSRYTEVVINGQYVGVYMLIETIKRDKNRVNISKMKATDVAGDSLTGGYILSMDKADGGGYGGDFKSTYPPIPGGQQETWFHYVYPRPEVIEPQQAAYIQSFMRQFENAMNLWVPNQKPGTPDYEDWINTDTWIDYLLVNELSKNVDGYRLSSYFYKDRDDKDGRIVMGPVWDYNIAFGIGDYCEGQYVSGWMKDFNRFCGQDAWVIHFWWNKLLQDRTFQLRVADRWQQLREGPWGDARLAGIIDSTAALLQQAQVRNFQRWPVIGQYVWPNSYIGNSYAAEIDYLKNWTLDRAAWIDKHIEEIGPIDLKHFPFVEDARIFPNPVVPGTPLYLFYSTHGTAPLSISITDMAGRIVLPEYTLPVGAWQEQSVTIPAELAPGLYVYQLKIDSEQVKWGKLVVGR